MGIVVEAADESEFWLAFIKDAAIDTSSGVERLLEESGELLAIFTASLATAKENARRKRRERLAAKRSAVLKPD